jgi:hypothetical protein
LLVAFSLQQHRFDPCCLQIQTSVTMLLN